MPVYTIMEDDPVQPSFPKKKTPKYCSLYKGKKNAC